MKSLYNPHPSILTQIYEKIAGYIDSLENTVLQMSDEQELMATVKWLEGKFSQFSKEGRPRLPPPKAGPAWKNRLTGMFSGQVQSTAYKTHVVLFLLINYFISYFKKQIVKNVMGETLLKFNLSHHSSVM